MSETAEGFVPATVVIDPNNPAPGATVSITVTLNGFPKQNQPVNIAATPGNFFSSIPSSVVVQAGHNSVEFEAAVSANAAGGCTVTASCNGGSADGTCQALVPPGG
jgi:hypothetical protein